MAGPACGTKTAYTTLVYGVAGYVVCRATETAARREIERITDCPADAAGYANYEQWLANTQLEQRVSLEDYSVSNRGLRRDSRAHRSKSPTAFAR